MKQTAVYVTSIFFLLLTLPWFSSTIDAEPIFGFPPWAFYALLAAFLYPVVMSFLYYRYWNVSAVDEEDEE